MTKRYAKVFLVLLMLLPGLSRATVWIVTNSGNSFSPSVVTIELGDTVMFNIASIHNSVEVSQATWNANGSTSNGGWMLPFGGGMVIPTLVQTYYYVCQPHSSMGMKGQVIVNPATGIDSPVAVDGSLKFRPNPAQLKTRIHTGLPNGTVAQLTVFEITGKAVYRNEAVVNDYMLDLATFNKGIYFVEIRSEGYIRTAKLVVEN